MRYFTTILFLLVTSTTFAANSDNSLDEFFEHYINSYGTYLNAGDDGDISSVTSHFAEPSMQVPPKGAPRVATTTRDLDRGFTGFLGMLKSKGAVRLEWEKKQVVQLSDTNALASNVARVIDADGQVVDRRSSVYTLFRSASGWKIAMIQSFPVEKSPTLKQ